MRRFQIGAQDCFYSHEDVEPYVPDEPIGLLLGFNCFGVFLDRNPGVIDAIAPGGYLVHNKAHECLVVDVDQHTRLAHLSQGPLGKYFRELAAEYERQGRFEAIKIFLKEHQMFCTFLQKVR